MKNRGIYPTITPELHLLIKENALWALQFSNSVNLKEIEFDEDEWRHDCQYTIEDRSLGRLERILDFNLLYEPKFNDPTIEMDEQAKIAEDEEIIPQFIVILNRYKFLIFPLKSAVHLGRGIICDLMPG